MSDEINLILTKLKLVSEIEENGAYVCDKEHSKILYDYITDLQEKYDRMKENAITLSNGYNDLEKRNEKAIEYIGNGNIGIPRKTRDKFIAILKGEDNTPENLYVYTPEKGFRLVGDDNE